MNEYRLKTYLQEANVHIERLREILKEIKKYYPLNLDTFLNFNLEEKNLFDAFVFRFAKLQDLIGAKIFRNFLEYSDFITKGKSFLEILREIEKEGIIDIDTWMELRKIRNFLSHDYPQEDEEKIEYINLLIEKIPILFEVVEKIESKVKRI